MKAYFESFPEVTALFSQRGDDGYSNGLYYSCNLGLNTGDDKITVLKNRGAFLDNFEQTPKDAAFADQRHTDNVALVSRAGIYPECDGLITDIPELPLLIQVADCACVFLYDSKHHAIGLVHSGWRGTAKEIVTKTVQLMAKEFNSSASDISAAISPCISQAHFEVGEDVHKLFNPYYLEKQTDGKYLFDMKQVVFDELSSLGIDDIHIDSECTFANSVDYYSYRRDREKSGRMMGGLMLQSV